MLVKFSNSEKELLHSYKREGFSSTLQKIIAELETIEGLAFTVEKSLRLSDGDAFNEGKVIDVVGERAFELRLKVEKLHSHIGCKGGES